MSLAIAISPSPFAYGNEGKKSKQVILELASESTAQSVVLGLARSSGSSFRKEFLVSIALAVETIYSADWLLPIEGEPIASGALAFENGRITRVGTSAELGAGRRFPGAVIMPGLVNAHVHLEYSGYTGFGDGLDFGGWIALHLRRKLHLSFEDVVALARLGAAECLASGITTVVDASYSGASPLACSELGLKAIVGLEVFGGDPEAALARFEKLKEIAAPSAVRAGAVGNLAARALHGLARGLRRRSRAGRAGRDPPGRECGRAGLAHAR